MQSTRTRRRVYAWLLIGILFVAPLFWAWQSASASPYATALAYRETGEASVPDVHPAVPSRLERFGTDGLGRDVTVLTAHALLPTLALCATAAAMRTGIAFLTRKRQILSARLSNPFLLAGSDFALAFVGSLVLPLATGSAFAASWVLGAALGLFFPPAWASLQSLPADAHPARKAVLVFLSQFLRIWILVALLGVFGRTLGANPYAVLPANGSAAVFTHPHLMNLMAAWRSDLSVWWVGAIPLAFVLLVVLVGTAAHRAMKQRLAGFGSLLTPAQQTVVAYVSPRQLFLDLRRPSERAGRLFVRGLIAGLAIFAAVMLWEPAVSADKESIAVTPLADIRRRTAAAATEAERLDFAESLFAEWKLNPLQESFRIAVPNRPNETVVAAGLLGGSRTQPLLYFWDISGTDEEFAAAVAVAQGVVETVRGQGAHQSVLFLFANAKAPSMDLKSILESPMLHTPERIFFASIAGPTSNAVHVDETLLLPSGGWSAQVALCFSGAFRQHGFDVVMDTLPPNTLVTAASSAHMSGLQAAGDPTQNRSADWQQWVNALVDAGARFAFLKTP